MQNARARARQVPGAFRNEISAIVVVVVVVVIVLSIWISNNMIYCNVPSKLIIERHRRLSDRRWVCRERQMKRKQNTFQDKRVMYRSTDRRVVHAFLIWRCSQMNNIDTCIFFFFFLTRLRRGVCFSWVIVNGNRQRVSVSSVILTQ